MTEGDRLFLEEPDAARLSVPDRRVAFFNARLKRDLTPIFDQYLRRTAVPALELAFDTPGSVRYRWKADETGFQHAREGRARGRMAGHYTDHRVALTARQMCHAKCALCPSQNRG